MSNMAESFNAWIKDTREFPIITMCEMIRRQMLVRFQTKKAQAMKMGEMDVPPRIRKKLELSKKNSRGFIVFWDGEDGFEVEGTSGTFVVGLHQRTCSCQMWDLTGIPCAHACAAMFHVRLEPENYVDFFYSETMYEKAYDGVIGCIPGIMLSTLFWY